MSSSYTGERFLPEECRGEMAVEHYQRYQFAKQLVKGKRVLDAACGEGYGSSLLAEAADHVTGLDIDGRAVESANQKYAKDNLEFKEGSIDKLPFEDHVFDMVVSYETIEHVDGKMQENFLNEIRRVLKKDGTLIMSTPNKAVYTDLVNGHNLYHIKEFYVNEYQEFLSGYFKNTEMFCQYPNLGYFITRENESVTVYNKKGRAQEECRYVIAICSDEEQTHKVNTDDLVFFEDQMYYDLNRYAHEKDQQILDMKAEAEAFQQQLEESIRVQKEYIRKLEDDLRLLKEPYKALLLNWKHPLRYLKKKMNGK